VGDPVFEERRAIVPPVLVIEYISDAVSWHNLQDCGDVSSVTAWLIKALIGIFVRINKAGVTHQDVGLRNILIGPRRAVVVDFGEEKTRPRGGRMCNRRGK
jgi:tRNA A-37 threonylcarbamoyl transferase component Bud32